MPNYFFDWNVDGRVFKDELGLELDGVESIRQQAARALGELAKGLLSDGNDKRIELRVRDNEDQRVLTAALALQVDVPSGT